MKINEKLTQDLRKKIGDLSSLNTTNKDSLVGAINEANNKIIYDYTLTSNQNRVDIPCDLLSDGGIYDFIFKIVPSSETTTSDYKMIFNNNNQLSYCENMFGAFGDLTSEGQLNQSALYRGFQSLIGDYWGSSQDKKKPLILEGRITLQDNITTGSKVIQFEIKCMKNTHDSQVYMVHTGISTTDVSNLTSINMIQTSNNVNNYGVGSRFILKKF